MDPEELEAYVIDIVDAPVISEDDFRNMLPNSEEILKNMHPDLENPPNPEERGERKSWMRPLAFLADVMVRLAFVVTTSIMETRVTRLVHNESHRRVIQELRELKDEVMAMKNEIEPIVQETDMHVLGLQSDMRYLSQTLYDLEGKILWHSHHDFKADVLKVQDKYTLNEYGQLVKKEKGKTSVKKESEGSISQAPWH